MQDTHQHKPKASEKATLGAQVARAYHREFQVIQEQRGDDTLSDTVRAALEEFRLRHWRSRMPTEEVA